MGNKFCQKCNNEVLATLRFCPRCGSNAFAGTLPSPKAPSAPASPIPTPPNPTTLGAGASTSRRLRGSSTNAAISAIGRGATVATGVQLGGVFGIGALFLLFVLLVYPLVNESSNSSCHALEKKAFSLITKRASQNSGDQITGLFGGAVLAELTNGELAGAYIKQVYPSIPPFIGCTIAYWKILTNPTALEDLLRPLQNSGLHL